MLKILRLVTLLGLAWLFLHCLFVTADGARPFTGKADVAVVLGNTVFADGSLSPWLKGRVDEALRLYRNRQVDVLFVSGGIGKTRFPEGDGMRNYLLQQGVPDAAIVVDNAGDNSYLTAKNLMQWNGDKHYRSAVVVTSYYHVTRSRYIVDKMGMEEVAGASSAFRTMADWYGLLREFPAFYKYLLCY